MYWIRRGWFSVFILLNCSANAKELLLVAGLEKPPYVISSSNVGFEIDLMRAVLFTLDHEISVVYVPYGRTYELMKKINADIGLTLTEKSGVDSEILSQPYVTYQNVAISLKEKSIKIDKIKDLQKYTLVAFQNASPILGSEFANAAKTSPLYIELPEQYRQVELLLNGKVDVVVMEINIFKYFAEMITGISNIENFEVHNLFPLTRYSAAITDTELRKAFRLALTKFVATAEYDELLNQYNITYLRQN
jgi:polar amino acid transport system substrate-binding protein